MENAESNAGSGLDATAVRRTYQALRSLARRRMRHEPPDHTLDPTALVHEALLRIRSSPPSNWDSDAHFYAAAAEAMRRILIERARRVQSLRHGHGLIRLTLDQVEGGLDGHPDDLLALDEALDQLARTAERKAELVKLRFFAGLTIEEAARALSISVATAKNDWAFARAWLRRRLDGER